MKSVGLPPLWRYSTVFRKQCKYGGRANLCGDVTPCEFVNSYRRFGGSWRLYLQGHVDQVYEGETEDDPVLLNVSQD
jgi:hypothetical protein